MNINKISNNSPLARGVAGGTRRGVANSPSAAQKGCRVAPGGLVATALCAIITATTAYAAGENIVASKKYTDDTFQTKIPVDLVDLGFATLPTSLVAYDEDDGLTGDKYGLVTRDLLIEEDLTLEDVSVDTAIPTSGAVWTELDNNWQPKISTGNVLVYDDDEDGVYDADDGDRQVPGLVAYDSTTGGLSGTKIGIADYDFVENWMFDDGWHLYAGDPYADRVVPTIGAVGRELQNIWNSFPRLDWTNTQTAAVNNYSTTFDDTTNNWFSDDASKMITGPSLANGLALKQNKITAHAANAVDSVLTDSTTAGNVQKRAIYDGSATYAAATHANQIPTMGAVMSKMQTKIPAKTTPQGLYTNGSVLTYTDTAGTVGEKYIIYGQAFDDLINGIMQWTPDYENMLVDAEDIGNALSYKQNKITAHAAGAADSVLTDSTTAGNVQKRAIYDGSATYAAATHASQIPTMGAVMSAITNGTPKITWSATQTAAVNNYSTTFNGTANNWVATDSGKLVDGNVLANAVALKQNKVPAGTAGNVVTYTGTAGVVGSVATYDGSTTYAAATDANKIATAAFVETKQKKKVCAGWPDDVAVADRTDANCWLWYFPD